MWSSLAGVVEGVGGVGVCQVNKLSIIIFSVAAISCLIYDSNQQSQWPFFLTRVYYLQQQHKVANECVYQSFVFYL